VTNVLIVDDHSGPRTPRADLEHNGFRMFRPPVDGDQPVSSCYIADAVAALATPPDSQSALRSAISDADFVPPRLSSSAP
jgi:hypothetical protein